MASKLKLGINIDHVATIRNARGGLHPDPIKAALIAQSAGADNITAHLREDRRHISDIDIKKLVRKLRIPLNLEMAPTKEMLKIAINSKVKRVCLVPEKRKEITTEGGLNVIRNKKKISLIITKLQNYNIKVSLFIDPCLKQIGVCKELKASSVELHTGEFCDNKKNKKKEFIQIKKSANFAKNNKLECHAGHGLKYNDVKEIAKINEITELNIGHFIIGESIFDGLKQSILKMRKIIDSSRKKSFYLKSA
ncbi:MAG: Pyridoxine 5'-phosphate synthase [Alphaproteobacteria bacterium MarineAlpha6_Bin6]|nr:pyridoxine 5'-phosphate synthase [Pelagibacteraceae bacterium]PPR31813.1 MAG: Pyridoxine 5'-phosphate synthase [Alphaproteobacteria bacterium MarineAlpha6_Bin6]PPR33243.1 MAG: Pyridoxine 5'-phosphate synthase [Alphaproteobacteria bacterium MarineAlpha6_Bin5]|tara:strand:+ start:3054 stop:3806 length:753 start_codon:yes stop_codon:yes gene_type:complete